MMIRRGRSTVLGCLGCLAASAALAAVLLGTLQAPEARADADSDPALRRTREQVKMLDNLYKNAVVSITKTYVDVQEKRPAIMVAKDIFGAMRKGDWHSARLVDASGDPLGDENAPKTDFEKAASRAMRSGQSYFEQIVGQGDNRRLLAATVVPVVMQKCADCHTGKKVGDLLGFIRYDIPIK